MSRLLYLNADHIDTLGADWNVLADTIEHTVRTMDTGDFAQPVKPYLRYLDPANRIIAMPAFIGGASPAAGIKWIASFPGNIHIGLPRAHSVTILNEPLTGVPQAIVNTPVVSGVRTAAVSSVVLRRWLAARPRKGLCIGIIGWGPIGRLHYKMCCDLFGDHVDRFLLFDIRGVDVSEIALPWRARTSVVSDWRTLYAQADVCITCTVAKQRYIDDPPKPGMLLLNVSLRDYTLRALHPVRSVIVDDWDEVCRENTDIELLHREGALINSKVCTLADVVIRDALQSAAREEPVLFCPMGMAVFDIAVAMHYVQEAGRRTIGIELE